MEEYLEEFFAGQNSFLLAVEIAALIAVLVKAADWLVGEAVVLSERAGLPKVVIGATIVSLGTTTPEAAVSVLAAIQGKSELALGNAVGSVICDTGLILGIACLISPPQLPRRIVNRQGWLQLAAGILLVASCVPWRNPLSAFTDGGHLSQVAGMIFVGLLISYLWITVVWAKQSRDDVSLEEFEHDVKASTALVVSKLIVGLALVVASCQLLIPGVTIAAERMSIPEGVIAATLVAFGTSLPELVTAVAASRRGHGDLAVGNIIGADILNVLFVAGTAAAFTKTGLVAGPSFFRFLFPAMLFVLVVFRVGTIVYPNRLPRGFGWILLAAYVVTVPLLIITEMGRAAAGE